MDNICISTSRLIKLFLISNKMKSKNLFFICLNAMSLIVFVTVVFLFNNNKIAISLSLFLLFITALFTAYNLNKKSIGSDSSFNFMFFLLWNMFSVVILLGSIFIWKNSGFLLNFSMIFLCGSIGATIGAYYRYRKLRNRMQ